MAHKTLFSLLGLPIDIIYRIMDKLDDFSIVYSMHNVCMRLNDIIDTYYRYQVIFHCVLFTQYNYIDFHVKSIKFKMTLTRDPRQI